MSYTGGENSVADGAWEDGFEEGKEKVLEFIALLIKLEEWQLNKVIDLAEELLKEKGVCAKKNEGV